jgi:hypothetical protein
MRLRPCRATNVEVSLHTDIDRARKELSATMGLPEASELAAQFAR